MYEFLSSVDHMRRNFKQCW